MALVVCAVLLLVDLVRSIDHNYQISRQIRALSGQIAAEQDRQLVLREAITYYQSKTYKELAARRQLGLAKPGETLVLAPENRDPESTTPTGAPSTVMDVRRQAREDWSDLPPYQQWWLLFFGPPAQLEAVFGS